LRVRPAAGHGDEIAGAAAQLGADGRDDQVEIAVWADDASEDLARDRFFGREDHGLDPAHPRAPAQLGRERVEVRIEDLGSWSAAHGVKVRRGERWVGR
jgi:hypothetical protein